jgi:RNA polymerase sigma factor (sigma-70 family)
MQTTELAADHSEFFRTNYGSLVGYVRNLIRDGADIAGEDIVQDVMVNLYNKADITQPIQNFTAYVYSALRNRIIDIMRTRKKNISLDAEGSPEHQMSLAEFLHDAKTDISATIEKKELRHALYKAIDGLSDSERAIVAATEFDDRTFKELSEEWEIPIGTLLARKSRALKHIGAFLQSNGHT